MMELDLIEVIRIVMKNRRLIIFIVSIAMVAAITYSMLAPMIWSSEAVFYARSNRSLELTQSASSMSKMIKDLVESSAQDEAMACVNIMKSRSFTEEVIRRYSLIDYFKLTDPDSLANMDDALEKIPRVVFINYDEDENLVYVRIETKSKALSRNIADFYVTRLEDYLKHSRMVKGRTNRIYLEQRVNELWTTIDSLQTAISQFQTEHKAVNLREQSSQLVLQYSDLIASKMKLEVDLVLAKTNYDANSPIVKDLELRLATLGEQISKLEKADTDALYPFRLDMAQLPSLSARMAMMQLQYDVMRVVYDYVRPQYDAAILEELQNLPHLEILDQPRESGRRVKPRRGVICIVTLIMASFLSIVLAVYKELFASQSARLSELKASLK
jgi:uncharacterized protein involved in exopolysaccharide biosynthesis